MSSHNADRVRRLFERAWNEGDMTVVSEVVHDEFVFSRDDGQQRGGPNLYSDLIASSRAVFPDMTFFIDDVIVGADEPKVVVRWTMTGTHEGEFKGVAPTGETVELDGIEINRFEDGQLVQTWTHPNWVGFLEDVGVLPLDED
ncbi:MAG: ester cyclase [Haloarculaceae archaeon]